MPAVYTLLFFGTIFIFHWIIYRFLLSTFKIEKKKTINILRLVFAFLSVSFILAMIISHLWDNFFTRGFYIISGLWYGLFINLLLAIGAFWLIAFLLHVVKIELKRVYLAYAALVFAIIFSILGVLNVYFPRIKEVDVTIKDLPKEWQGKTIVQLSDVHLGKVFGADFLDMIVKKTNALNPDIVLITGDLFDGMDGLLKGFVEPLSNIKAKDGVYYANGNHEIYSGLEEAFNTVARANITILRDDVVEINGLQLIGVSYPEFSGNKDIVKIISENKIFDKNKPNILLFHSPTDINQEVSLNRSQMYFYPNVDFSTAKELGVDLQLSGHTHKGQLFPFNFLTHFIYGGYDYGLHRLGDFQIYIASGIGGWGPTMRTSGRSEIVKIVLQ